MAAILPSRRRRSRRGQSCVPFRGGLRTRHTRIEPELSGLSRHSGRVREAPRLVVRGRAFAEQLLPDVLDRLTRAADVKKSSQETGRTHA
jgi:hypothetical protein